MVKETVPFLQRFCRTSVLHDYWNAALPCRWEGLTTCLFQGSLNISIYENGYTESNLHYEDITVFGVKGNSLQSFSINGKEQNSLNYTIKEKVSDLVIF